MFAGINGILSRTHSNIPPGCTCCWRQSTGKSDLQADFQVQRNLLSKLIINYFFFFLIAAVCLNFEFYFCDQTLVPAPFPDQSQGWFFSPCRIKNNNVLQLGCTFVWVLAHLIRHPQWNKPADFLTPQPSMELNFVSDQNSWYLCWFYKWWNFIFQFYKLILQIFGKNHPTV